MRAEIPTEPFQPRRGLAGGHRMIDKLNYKNERTRFMFNMSDAASAILLERDAPARKWA